MYINPISNVVIALVAMAFIFTKTRYIPTVINNNVNAFVLRTNENTIRDRKKNANRNGGGSKGVPILNSGIHNIWCWLGGGIPVLGQVHLENVVVKW